MDTMKSRKLTTQIVHDLGQYNDNLANTCFEPNWHKSYANSDLS